MAVPRGILLNCTAAQCSIYESGRMFHAALRDAPEYALDYREISRFEDIPRSGYDFYVFNYHHVTMAWLDTKRLRELPGPKLTFVLEMLPGNPFVFCPKDFDAYCVPDPTHRCADPRVFAFPRPLEQAPALPPHVPHEVPWIGSFGFATPGKGFEVVVHAVNKEFERAVVRLNIPAGTHADPDAARARQLGAFCQSLAKPGIEVRLDHRFLAKDELIRWCAENTLNVFFYHRNQPGLSATTDQAIVAGRPLLVSPCDTFRHIHEHIRPYPGQSLRAAIAETGPAVAKMRELWAKERFAARFAAVLATVHAGQAPAVIVADAPRTPRARRRVLFVNHAEQACGIHEFGRRVAATLEGEGRSEFVYAECDSAAAYTAQLAACLPDAVVCNYYPATMPWVTAALVQESGVPHAAILHEVTGHSAAGVLDDVFDLQIAHDPTLIAAPPRLLRAGRPLAAPAPPAPPPDRPTIGSFGFALPGKGFARLVAQVESEFDTAVIRLHMPRSPFGDPQGKELAACVAACRAAHTKPGIVLEITHELLATPELLAFLAGNSINVFLYDTARSRGISSVPDLALAVDRPLAVSRSPMFRHLHGLQPSICVEDRPLRAILADGTAPLQALRAAWSATRLRGDYEAIVAQLLARREPPAVDLFGAALRRIARAHAPAAVLCVDPAADGLLLAAVREGLVPSTVTRGHGAGPEAGFDLVCASAGLGEAAADRRRLLALTAGLAPGGHLLLGRHPQEAADPAALAGLRETLCQGLAGLELAFASADAREPWIVRRRRP